MESRVFYQVFPDLIPGGIHLVKFGIAEDTKIFRILRIDSYLERGAVGFGGLMGVNAGITVSPFHT